MSWNWRMKKRAIALCSLVLVIQLVLLPKLKQYVFEKGIESLVLSNEPATPEAPVDLLFTDQGGCNPAASKEELQALFRNSKRVDAFAHTEILLLPDESPVTTHLLPEFDHKLAKGMVVTLRDAYVSGAWGMAFDCKVSYFAGGCRASAASFPSQKLGSTAVELGDVVVLVQYWGYGYFHWLIEDFLRIGIVYDFLIANPEVKILTYSISNSKSFYDMIGISQDRFIGFNDNTLYRANRVLYPTATHCGEAQAPALSRLQTVFRSHLRQRFPELENQSGVYVVVQDRGNGKSRSLRNHEDLVLNLKADFPSADVVVFNNNDDLWTTGQKHYSATLIIGPHGAGLSNVIFTKNSTVIEIHPDKGNGDVSEHKINICHQQTALRSGANHISIIADNGKADTPFSAPLDQVMAAAHRVLDPLFISESTTS